MRKLDLELIRGIDPLGRVLIPGDLRKPYGFTVGTKLVLIPREDGILVKAVDPENEEE